MRVGVYQYSVRFNLSNDSYLNSSVSLQVGDIRARPSVGMVTAYLYDYNLEEVVFAGRLDLDGEFNYILEDVAPGDYYWLHSTNIDSNGYINDLAELAESNPESSNANQYFSVVDSDVEVIFKLERTINDSYDGQGSVGSVAAGGWAGAIFCFSGATADPYFEVGRALYNQIQDGDVRKTVIAHPSSIVSPDYQNAGNLNAGTVPDARLANSSLFVTGMIMMYTGSTAPSGWAICNGSNGTPDLRDRFIVGAGSAYSVNNTGGANSVTLTESQIPSHNHTFSGSTSHSHTINNHTHSFSGSGSNTHSHNITTTGGDDHNDSVRRTQSGRNDTNFGLHTMSTNDATISISISGNTGNPSDRGTNSQTISISGNTGNKGGGGSHENRPPYYALMFIMKL